METRQRGSLFMVLTALIVVAALFAWGGGLFSPGSPAMGGEKMRTKWNSGPGAQIALDKTAPDKFETATFALG